MRVAQYCKHSVVTIQPSADIVEAARLMRDQHVGFLVVVEERSGRAVPVGVLTDRDIVVQVNARDIDLHSVTVADAMTREPVIAAETDDLRELLQQMRASGVRRAPVVDDDGSLTGILSIDDAIDLVTDLMCDICGSIRNEQRIERQLRTG